MQTLQLLSKIKSNQKVNLIINRLLKNKHDVFIVGGFIRDFFLNNEQSNDIDIVSSASIEVIYDLFKDQKINLVGKSYLVLIINGIEVSTYRKDIYNNTNLNVVEVKTIQEDANRRDLTINQIYVNCKNGDIIDDHGGRNDLQNRIVKFIGNPDKRIEEDPNRMIRACRFVAKLNGTFDVDTIVALRKNAKKYKIAPERIRLEILKAMKIQKASLFFEALWLIGMLDQIFPSLNDCWNHPHGKHHIEDVFEHNMIAGDSIYTNDPILKLTGYLHDVGKPKSYEDEKFIDHEKDGEVLLKDELKKLTFSNDEIERITGLVRLHMNSIQKMSPKAIRKLLKKFDERNINVKDFIRLRMADRKANLARENFTLSEWKEMYKQLINPVNQEIPFSIHDLDLSGGEIIKDFNLKPGPEIGEIQRELLNFVIENGTNNDKEILKNYVKDLLVKK